MLRAAQTRTFPGVDAGPAQLAATERAESELSIVAEHLCADGVETEPHVYYDDPAAAILDAARRLRVDLIAMSTHGRTGLGRWVYGSVADTVLRGAQVPILLAPAGAQLSWPHAGGLRVLVPLDGSELAQEAIGPAQMFAETFGAELLLLRVVEPPSYPLYGDGYAYVPIDAEVEVAEARRYLEEEAGCLRTSGLLRGDGRAVEVQTAVGQPAAEIARVAREQHADLIAMATHGRGGLARLVMGSVATGVLQRAGLPILLTRPPAVRQPVPQPATRPEAEPAGPQVTVTLTPRERELVLLSFT